MEKRTLYIIDGHSQVFKAYHAIQNLSTSTGIPTNAVYGFTQILQRLLKTREPQYVVVTFDSGTPTFRHDMYASYKANRQAPPEDFPLQLRYIQQVLEALRIPILQSPGYEADDIIATVTRRAEADGFDVVIVTADKDLFQLVDDHVKVLRLEPDNETEFDREAVKGKTGVYPEQVLDMLAMIGDSSDNIPGIHKIGPKTAATLLDQYGTLDEVLANTDKLKGKQKEYIEAGRDNAILSRKLASLHYSVPLEFCCDQFVRKAPDFDRLAGLYKELEFRRLLEELQPLGPAHETCYELVTSEAQLRDYLAEVRKAGLLALDTESDTLVSMEAKLVGISLSVRPGAAVYIPLGHEASLTSDVEQLDIDQVRPLLGPVLRDPQVRKVGHAIKFDRKLMRKYGLDVDKVAFDTLLASWLLNPDKRAHGLKELAGEVLGIKMTQITELIGKGRTAISFAQVEPLRARDYACADADMTLQLYHLLDKRLDETGMRELFEKIELPLIDVLMDMETTGVRINPKHFAGLSKEMQEQLNRLGTRIFELVGHPFNLASPKQVGQVLFEELKLAPRKEKKTMYSTDVEVLEELSAEHEVPKLLLEYRQIEKLRTTYVDVLPSMVCRSTGRIHTSYNQASVATGRLSSSDPNLQNIPVRTELGRKIREGFLPSSPDNVLLSADYSQIELRVLAHVTKDPGLVSAFREERDVHTLTASKVFGCSPSDVTYEMRDRAKVINFGIIYGMSPHGLSQRLKIPVGDAKRFIEEYFHAYAGVKTWVDQILETARSQGYVTTLSGRRRYLPDINSRNFNARSGAERIAINAPIQGTSADMIKIAMINIHDWLKKSRLGTRMIMQVHDELIFDVPKKELEKVTEKVRDMMQEALPLDVPVRVDINAGHNWAEC